MWNIVLDTMQKFSMLYLICNKIAHCPRRRRVSAVAAAAKKNDGLVHSIAAKAYSW